MRLRVGRLRRERQCRAGARGAADGDAEAAPLRDLRRRRARRRAALRRRDRRLRRALRVTLGERLLELARSDERAVLFTVLEGEHAAEHLLVLLERGETVGDAPARLAELAPGLSRNGIVEH